MFPRHPERLKGFDYVGEYAYFLTFCTDYRHRAFVSSERVQIVSTQILRAASEEGFALIAYCYMPDHVHLLVTGERENSDCKRFISLSKQLSGYHYQKAFGRKLWQRYGFEHVLRADEDLFGVARYVVENPVRARIVDSVCDYPFTGSALYTVSQIIDSLPWSPSRRDRSG
jgi:putative transposase